MTVVASAPSDRCEAFGDGDHPCPRVDTGAEGDEVGRFDPDFDGVSLSFDARLGALVVDFADFDTDAAFDDACASLVGVRKAENA